MTHRPSFAGFEELVRRPLEKSDPVSYGRIVQALEKVPGGHAAPFAWLLSRMVGKRFTPEESRLHWERIIALKAEMEHKLGWAIDIQTAAVEYFARRRKPGPGSVAEGQSASPPPQVLSRPRASPEAPDYHLVRLKEEVQRSKRYKHALSAIMVDAQGVAAESGERPEDGAVRLARVIERTIRTVDILAHCGGLRFLIILPSTNRREAEELAERVAQNIGPRERSGTSAQAGRLLMALEQWSPDTTAAGLVAALQAGLRAPDEARAAR